MDTIDKFYFISDIYNDDIHQVSKILKKHGVKGRPSRIAENLSNLFLDRYALHIDIIYWVRKYDDDRRYYTHK